MEDRLACPECFLERISDCDVINYLRDQKQKKISLKKDGLDKNPLREIETLSGRRIEKMQQRDGSTDQPTESYLAEKNKPAVPHQTEYDHRK